MLHDLQVLPHKANWASLVRQLLMSLDFYEVCLAQGVGNVDVFLSTFKQRLNDNFIQNWRDQINGSTHANFYTAIAQFQFQTTLENINIYKYFQAMSKLRMPSHRLAIESGRWVKPIRLPIEERKCTDCNVLEDEYHFIFECNRYTELRKEYIPKYHWNRPSMFKLVELLNSTNIKLLRNLCIYIFQAFKSRTEQVYGP